MWILWFAGETGRGAADLMAQVMTESGETVEVVERRGGFEQVRDAVKRGARVLFLASPEMADILVPLFYVDRFAIIVVDGDPDAVIPPSLRDAEVLPVPRASAPYYYEERHPKMAEPPPAAEPTMAAPPEMYEEALESVGEPEPPTTDYVHFTVTAPSFLKPGSTEEINLWCHLDRQREEMLERAREAHGTDKLAVKPGGPAAVERGTMLTVVVDIEGLDVQPRSKKLLWTGEIGNAGFTVAVPSDAAPGPRKGSASIRVNDAEIGRLDFVLNVKRSRSGVGPVRSTYRRHRKAFASYASKDREKVLARVQGIQKAAPQLEIFVDLVTLRSGRYWQKELEREIPASDVFYLFWSRNARKSKWVEREWRCALKAKGLDFIDPVPLESPKLAPPPRALATKHFNDLWLVVSQAG